MQVSVFFLKDFFLTWVFLGFVCLPFLMIDRLLLCLKTRLFFGTIPSYDSLLSVFKLYDSFRGVKFETS